MNKGFFNLVTRPHDHRSNYFWAEGLASDESTFLPSVDIQETSANWLLAVDVPGVKKEDIKIDIEGKRLLISGQRQSSQSVENEDENGAKWSHVERRFGSFSRSFSLPETVEVEGIKADQKDGVLKIVIPKKAAAAKKTIAIE